MATDRFTKSPASRKRMSELISRIGKDESQDAGDLLTDEAVEDLPEEMAKPRGSQTSKSREMAFADEPTIQEVPEGVEYRTEDSAGGAARPLGEIGGYGRVDEEAFSKMLDEAEPFSFEDEKKLVAQQVAAPENYGTWEGGGGYTYTHVTDAPGGPYIKVEKEGKSPRRVVPGTKGIGGSDMYGRILAEKTLLDADPKLAKAFYESLPEGQREAIEAAGNVDVSGKDGVKTTEGGEPLPKPGAGKGPLEETYTFDAYVDAVAGDLGEDAGREELGQVDVRRDLESTGSDTGDYYSELRHGSRGSGEAKVEPRSTSGDLGDPAATTSDYVAELTGEEPVRDAAAGAAEMEPRRGSGGSGEAKVEPRRGAATASPEDLEFYQGIGEARDIAPAEGAAKAEPRRGDLDTSSDPGSLREEMPLRAHPAWDADFRASVNPPRRGADDDDDKKQEVEAKRAEMYERHKPVAADFMASVGPLSREVPDAVKAEGEEATEYYVLSLYVLKNGGSPKDVERAQYFAERGETDQLLELFDNLPTNALFRDAREYAGRVYGGRGYGASEYDAVKTGGM